jgi:hypothetical protein
VSLCDAGGRWRRYMGSRHAWPRSSRPTFALVAPPWLRSSAVARLVTTVPVDPTRVEVGDIILTRVAGTTYLHLISAVEAAHSRVQISNNRGRVNGWTNPQRPQGALVAMYCVPSPCLYAAGRQGRH